MPPLVEEDFPIRTFQAGAGSVHALAYTPDESSIVLDLRDQPTHHPGVACSYHPARELVWWNPLRGIAEKRFVLRDSLLGPHGALQGLDYGEIDPEQLALDVSYSPATGRVATAWEWTDKEEGVCVFDAERQQTIDFRTPYNTHIERLVLAPDGKKLLAATVHDMDGSTLLEVWELEREPEPEPEPPLSLMTLRSPLDAMRRQRLAEMPRGHPNPWCPLSAVAFNGRYVAAAGTREPAFLTWDSHGPPPQPESDDHWDEYPSPDELADRIPRQDVGFVPGCLAFAGGSSLLAVGGEGIDVFDVATRRGLSFTQTGESVRSLAFTADGRSLLAGSADGTVTFWDAATGRRGQTFDWRCGAVTAVACSPSGQTAAAGTATGTVVIWDLET